MDEPNPFDPPGESLQAEAAPSADAGTPLPPKVIGVIGLVLGSLGILGMLANLFVFQVLRLRLDEYELLDQDPTVLSLLHVWSGILGIFLIVIGVGLIRYRRWARSGFNIYATLALLGQVVGTAYVFVQLAESDLLGAQRAATIGGFIGGVIGALLGCAFPLAGLILLNRKRVVASLS